MTMPAFLERRNHGNVSGCDNFVLRAFLFALIVSATNPHILPLPDLGDKMAKQVQFTVLIDKPIKDRLDAIKTQEGLPISAQLRIALMTWLESKGRPLDKPVALSR